MGSVIARHVIEQIYLGFGARLIPNQRSSKTDCNADQWTTTAQDEGEWRKTLEQGTERFMAKWIAAENVRAGLRYAVICLNVTGNTKERIAQGKRACAGSLAIVD